MHEIAARLKLAEPRVLTDDRTAFCPDGRLSSLDRQS
jgi:hypothetical protein